MSAAPLVDSIRSALRAEADPERAPQMQAYMKSETPFLGVPLPTVRKVATAAAREHPPRTLAELVHVVEELWDHAEFREERYAAAALLRRPMTDGALELVPLYIHLATTGAWWDHVDDLARHLAALHDAHPQETAALVRAWSTGDDMWLRRLAIISQLGRRERADHDLLAAVIEPNLDDTEFFIRKAIGWALRDHARVDPHWVRTFVASHADRMSALSQREALKHVG
ncbi:DNA alkylation repair protein [Aeromicrobium chenweiae]|uniref:DNA alkylation repair protein n=1 Tax=Aeromicrobium chenweiae TaxID=2079793 RepID=A0A2S0WJX3_9ACTN|nr:DNA alkylation repair protein [Aeromicrobium chenweiae]AWB91631.1 DNA alkylation repair protein [Aeromicrobium chenweiae]TGN32470.1 DNA alkylation repair protein [Aeromicrobium chenweiae]